MSEHLGIDVFSLNGPPKVSATKPQGSKTTTGHLCCLCCIDTSWFGGYLGWWTSRGWQLLATKSPVFLLFFSWVRHEQNNWNHLLDGCFFSFNLEDLFEERGWLLWDSILWGLMYICYLCWLSGLGAWVGYEEDLQRILQDHRHKWRKHLN